MELCGCFVQVDWGGKVEELSYRFSGLSRIGCFMEKRNFFKEFGRGVKSYGLAFKMLFASRFAWFMVFPILAWLLFFLLGGWLVAWFGNPVEEWIRQGITDWVGHISWLQNAGAFVAFVFKLLLRIGYFLLFVSVGGYLVLIVLSPVFSWLSERTETALTGKDYPFRLGRFLREMLRGILIALRNTFFQLLVSFILMLVSFIPLVGLVSPFLLFLSSAYFYMGIGLPFAAALLLPWGQFLVCGFVSLASVMAATVGICEGERRELE